MNRPPPHVHGKEGADGSSPSEGSAKAPESGALAYPVGSVRGVSYVLWVPRPEFPRSVIEFQRRFPDDEACRAYLFASRWPVRLPGLPRRRSRWRAPPSSVAVQVVRPPGIGHGWDGDAPDAPAADPVVLGGLPRRHAWTRDLPRCSCADSSGSLVTRRPGRRWTSCGGRWSPRSASR